MTAPVSASAPRRVAVPDGSRIPCTLESWADPEFGKARLGNSEPLGPVDPARPSAHASSLAAGQAFAATAAAAATGVNRAAGAVGARIVATLATLTDCPGTPI